MTMREYKRLNRVARALFELEQEDRKAYGDTPCKWRGARKTVLAYWRTKANRVMRRFVIVDREAQP